MARGSISGVVRDAAGTPQIGIIVELLRADSTLVGRVFTDRLGSYTIPSVMPGQYALKAIGTSFIPTLKENLRVRTGTVVDLTLNSLYDIMQWAPQPRRVRAQGQDDWAWTLRSAENRPLLRWLDDGSPILVWDGSAETQRKAQGRNRMRVAASTGHGQFGVGGEQVAVTSLRQLSARRRMALSTDISPDSIGRADALVGFRQEMANSGMGSSSMQTLAAVMVDQGVGAGGERGLTTATLRSWESLELLNTLEAEAGSDQVLARLGDGQQVLASLPFASLTLHRGQQELEYRVATALKRGGGEETAGAWLPVVSEREGRLLLEHGLHQELGWATSAGPAEVRLVIYGDSIENPMIEGAGRLSAAEDAGQWALLDGANGLLRATGPNYSSTGMMATFESSLPGHNRVKLSYASGNALVMPASGNLTKPMDVAVILKGAKARRTQMCSLALSGTADKLGTRWRASYRWQPETTVTEVAPYALDASEPFLNVYVRQPLWMNRQGPGGVEAQVDLRNLLAEGYQPFLTSDGTHLYFAQAQRAIRGGVAFTF